MGLSSSPQLALISTFPGPLRDPRSRIPQTSNICSVRWGDKPPFVSCTFRPQVSSLTFWADRETESRRRALISYASNFNNPSEESLKNKANTSSTSDSNGPPLLTILAGAVVFLLFCWVVGSIVMWLVGLILYPPSS